MSRPSEGLILPTALQALPLHDPPYSYVDGPNIPGRWPTPEGALDFLLELQKDTRYGVLSAGTDYWHESKLNRKYMGNVSGVTASQVACPAPHCILFGEALVWLITTDDDYKILDYQLIGGSEYRYDKSLGRPRRITSLDSQISNGRRMRYAATDQKGNVLDFRITGVFCSSFTGPHLDSEIRVATEFPMEDYKTLGLGDFIRKVEKDGRIISKLYSRKNQSDLAECIYDGW
ncbi:hypothetical protein SAMN04488038_1273 [Solimonas aquatica]|uniref:Uncharacterized protein n=2 Tax=Solimonas aquatica TaxID=489703 RepID=A0A1H9MLV7_9GAMM|nr:hypothetical protein SAMN04488038_1273 [Solimonas aquatica]